MKRLFLFFAISLSIISLLGCDQKSATGFDKQNHSSPISLAGKDDNETIYQAFLEKQSGIMVESSGRVLKVLNDDVQIPRHQRFIVRLASGQTLLFNHNIDLVRRIEDLKVEDMIYFRGQYEWNDKGGVIHWTHHDPRGLHPAGWIEHRGVRYE